MADAGDLEKLPPEIRNEIYALAFVQARPLILCNFGGDQKRIGDKGLNNEWARCDKAKVAPVGHRRRFKTIGYQYFDCTRRLIEAPSNVALLRVNKRVYAEATPVLYGRTKFRFLSPATLRRFLGLIGNNKHHLRDMGICGGGWKFRLGFYEARYPLEALAAARNIRIFEVTHLEVCPKANADSPKHFPGIDEVVKLCRPLLKSLRMAYKVNDLNANILEVIKIRAVGDPGADLWLGRNLGCDCTKKQMIEAHRDLQGMIKQSVAEQHNLELLG